MSLIHSSDGNFFEISLYWAKLVVPRWRDAAPFLVEHQRWINHLMEFQLEFLLDHMLVIRFWYVLLVEPSSCNLHEGTLVFLIRGAMVRPST